MSLLSPHKYLFRAGRSFQVHSSKIYVLQEPFQLTISTKLATASRTLSSSSQLGNVADSRTLISKLEPIERTSPQSQPVVELPVKPWEERLDNIDLNARLPRSVQALYLRPLRRKAEHGLPVCDLQLRSYSVRNLEFFADFALRAAYYLNLPISGPVPLPKIVERWTFPRSNFVHKKSQENFERITLRRLIQIKDGNSQAVQAWLAFLRKHAFYGVGMKANIWEYESLETAKNMDQALLEVEKNLEPHLSRFGRRETETSETEGSLSEFLGNERLSLNKGPLANARSG
ncbi:37S ribosomal protein S10, mitochondrial [Aspergillus cavernicola]|uniref:37S ribosomal protein S10, mitochondrial n=1 Tax=Aspergillus cavernicola TaxID=176166 RepID=A0ABR4HLL1_9EURO